MKKDITDYISQNALNKSGVLLFEYADAINFIDLLSENGIRVLGD